MYFFLFNKQMKNEWILNDNTTYEKLNENPEKELKKESFKLLNSWRIKGYLGGDLLRSDISVPDTSIPRINGLPKVH